MRLGATFYVATSAICFAGAASNIHPAELDFSAYSKVMFVFSSKASEVTKEFRHLPANGRAIADMTGRIERELKATWPPRYYLLDRDLKVIEAQEKVLEFPSFLKRVRP